jgi:hypothetical protein
VRVSPGRKSEEVPGEVASEEKTRTVAGSYDDIGMVKATECSAMPTGDCHPVGQRQVACHYCEDVLEARSWEVSYQYIDEPGV